MGNPTSTLQRAAAATFVVLTGCAFFVAGAQVPVTTAGSAPGDWLTFNRTLAGDRYSPLSEIDRSNVTRLRQICEFTLPEVTSLQTGPIIVGGTMFFTSDTISYAIDAGTCAERWKQVRHSDTPSELGVNRGFAYLNGRLFRGTSDAHVIALDTTDGRTVWDVTLDVAGPGVTVPMAPIAWNGLVYVGNAGGDRVGVTGHVYALDANDGRVVWRFDVVPDSGPARATWSESLPLSGGAFWTSFTLDESAGLLYVPAGNPAPDFDIALRPGANLYANSVIAIDARTGRMVAWNQVVKDDFHDWDVDSPPALVTTRAGRPIVASANKDGLLSVLDRQQLRDRDPAQTVDPASALPLLWQAPTTTRTNVDTPLSREQKTRFCPGIQGGSEWNGAAYHPGSNTLYVGAVDWCASAQLLPVGSAVPPVGDYWFGVVESTSDILESPDSAKGWLTAFDADSGSVRWKFAAPKPVLAAVTPTAGGLIFAADLGGTLYAFDAESGSVLWQTSSGQSMGGGIVTYTTGGRQRLAVASGMKSPIWPGAAESSRIIVYGLP